jgi:hypothetical protein
LTLSDKVAAREASLASRVRAPHPKGWEPGIRFDSEQVRYVTTEALPTLEGEPDWRSALAAMGVEIPDGYRVRIAEMKFDPVAWTRDSADQKYATTKPAWRYRFVIEPDLSTPTVDGIAILNDLIRNRKSRSKTAPTGDGTLILNLNDTQTGKDTGGGTPALLERLDHFFDLASDRVHADRKTVGDLVILLGGDLVEGCSIYPNQSFQIDLDRRAQVRTTTGIVLAMLDRFAPLFPTVRVVAVPGNHGEHRVDGKRVNRHDNDDQLVAEAAATAAERDRTLSHVSFNIAYEEPALTLDIQGHILAVTHGSVYGKGTGGSPDQKAYNWFKNMAASRSPVGDADVLVGNHFHHEIIRNFGSLLFIQNPAMDGGSPEFADYSGTDCPPGMASWIMTEATRFTGYEVLR